MTIENISRDQVAKINICTNMIKIGESLFISFSRELWHSEIDASAVAGHGAIPTALLLEHSSAIEMQIPAQ